MWKEELWWSSLAEIFLCFRGVSILNLQKLDLANGFPRKWDWLQRPFYGAKYGSFKYSTDSTRSRIIQYSVLYQARYETSDWSYNLTTVLQTDVICYITQFYFTIQNNKKSL